MISNLLLNGLLNRKEDRVKVIVYPVYISRSDRLMSMSYDEVINGCSAGIFPSYYEPWGYTPLETAARGSLTITTDCSGFGQFMASSVGKNAGIYILRRSGRSDSDIEKDLNRILYDIACMDKHAISIRKINARNLANLADWNFLIKNYLDAYDLAIKKSKKRAGG